MGASSAARVPEFLKLRDAASPTQTRCSTAPAARCGRATGADGRRQVNLSLLASVGSVSPYVRPVRDGVGDHARVHRAGSNLHGKVHARHRRAGDRQALVATAIGLFAAIPAVSRSTTSRDIDRIAIQLETFIGVLQHPAAQREPGRRAGVTSTPR